MICCTSQKLTNLNNQYLIKEVFPLGDTFSNYEDYKNRILHYPEEFEIIKEIDLLYKTEAVYLIFKDNDEEDFAFFLEEIIDT